MDEHIHAEIILHISIPDIDLGEIDNRIYQLWGEIHDLTGSFPELLVVEDGKCYEKEITTPLVYDGDRPAYSETHLYPLKDIICDKVKPLLEEYNRLIQKKKEVFRAIREAIGEYLNQAGEKKTIKKHGHKITIHGIIDYYLKH